LTAKGRENVVRKSNHGPEELGEAERREALGADRENGIRTRPPADDLFEPLSRSVRLAQRLARIEWHRTILSLRGRSRRAVLRLWEAVFVVTLTVACAIVLVHGVVGGFARLLGGAGWAGEIVGSIALLGTTVWVVLANQARRDRKHLRVTKARLESRSATEGPR
jgi:hypothetical protein